MKSTDTERILAEITAYQWGMVTSAQASMHGIARLDLSRLAADGRLERLAHGVYKDTGAPAGPHDDLKAAWLSTEPKALGLTRINDMANGVVVAGESAADLHGIGNFRAQRHEFVVPVRRQSQRRTVRYRQRMLDSRDVMLVDGLPVMTMERTIADLTEDVGELSLVADALHDAAGKRDLELERLSSSLAPLARRNGLKKGDGRALLDRLMEIAGIDPDAVARQVASDASLGPRVAANYFDGLDKKDLDRLVMSPTMQRTIQSLQESVATFLRTSMAPQLADVNATMDQFSAAMVKNLDPEEVALWVSTQLVSTDVIKELSRAMGKALGDSIALKPKTVVAIREAQRAVTRG